MTKRLIEQTEHSLDFLQKLFFEISYLIKEVEGLLGREDERFVIGRPSGYGVTSRTSSGLDTIGVDMWLPKTFTVFFCREQDQSLKNGQTNTPFKEDLRLLLLDIELANKNEVKPRLAAGCLYDIANKRAKDQTKFENLMWEFSYNHNKIFEALPKVDYSDSRMSIKGDFVTEDLFAINDSDVVVQKIVEPMLGFYRKG